MNIHIYNCIYSSRFSVPDYEELNISKLKFLGGKTDLNFQTFISLDQLIDYFTVYRVGGSCVIVEEHYRTVA